MSRSYRKPYATFCGGKSSANWDKTLARRCWRRLQNEALRTADDLEDIQMPKRYEAGHNDVRGWARDGKQRLQTMNHQYYNLYWLVDRYSPRTEEQLLRQRQEGIQRHLEWIVDLSRK